MMRFLLVADVRPKPEIRPIFKDFWISNPIRVYLHNIYEVFDCVQICIKAHKNFFFPNFQTQLPIMWGYVHV